MSEHPTPRVTIGLPVYNGEEFLRESLDALLAQTWTDFELLISDNASTDSTPKICEEYASRDPRIEYVRLDRNVGAAANHNLVAARARAPYFKWASHDDLYAPTLVERCLEALEQRPDAVLAHCRDAFVDAAGAVSDPVPYRLDSASPDPVVRFRSLLFEPGGNDFYGLIRTEVLRRVPPHDTYYNADRTFMANLVLQGPFVQVPEVLYFRRDHPGRASRAPGHRARAVALSPDRANRWRYPLPLMYAEYVLGFVRAVRDAPLSARDRRRATAEIARWFASCFDPRRDRVQLEAM